MSIYFSQLTARSNAPEVLSKIQFYNTMIFNIQQNFTKTKMTQEPKEDVASYYHAILLIKLENNMSGKLVKLHFLLTSPKPDVCKSHAKAYKTAVRYNIALIRRDR